jgi:GNAT superfamily N-acetyltransferase
MTLEQWINDTMNYEMLIRDAYLIAVTADGQYVGLTNMWADRASDVLYTGLTAVRREYRRKGIAAALKTRVLCWAKAQGRNEVRTDNADTNPMLQLNYRLGFRPIPAYVGLKKVIRAEAEQA